MLLLAGTVTVFIIFVLRGRSGGRNLLLISLDTVRADRLGCYGYGAATTPAIDLLSGRGVLFENAIAPAPLTLPSHTTLLTGLYPHVHGIRDNSAFKLTSKALTLAEILRKNGYRTGAVVGSFILDSRFGLDQGFDYYDDEMISTPVPSGRSPGGAPQPQMRRLSPRPASDVTRSALSWLRKNKGEHFFLWIHYFDPHYPYTPPAPFSERFSENPYDGEIAFVDHNIQMVLEELRKCRLLDRTLIVIVGDHGESLGEHGEETHSVFTYESTIRVPLIMSYPEKLPSGTRIAPPVSLADVVPTVLDILGVESAEDFNGASLVRLIGNGSSEERLIYSESMFSFLTYGWSQIACLRGPRWKYVKSTIPELYDLSADPSETKNLARAEEKIASTLAEELDSVITETSRAEGTLAEGISLSGEDREMLMALGYVTGDEIPGEDASLRDPKEMIRFHVFIDRGNKAFEEGRQDEAFEAFSQAMDTIQGEEMDRHLKGMMAMALNRLGLIYIQRQDTAAAGAAFQEAADLDSTLLDSFQNLGNIHLMNKNYRDAAASFEKALDISPGRADYYMQLAKIYTELGDTLKAKEAYRQARGK
jgi:arylsulfatase A-like enzyme